MSLTAIPAPTLFWEQHTCLPLSTAADVGDVLRYRRPGGSYICVNVGYAPHTKEMSLGFLDQFRRQIEAHPDLALAGGVADVDAARASGRIVVAFDLEDSRPLDGDLDMVETFYGLGVRALLPTYNTANAAGCGCLDTEDTGLTTYGRDLVRRMNEVGMLVDGSHCSTRTGLDLSVVTERPMIYSHSAMKGVWDHVRNITDEQARECAATGGVIGIPGVGIFLGENTATLDAFVAHIDYAVELVGWEHVGIGSDYAFDAEDLEVELAANPDLFPEEYTRWGTVRFVEPEVTVGVEAELLKRGYPAEVVAGILGGNFRRVAGQVWR
ncbi:dipeptidase [Dactylosporangium siamense]|uniref:Membrane dipeptidase n=1 Tax=Dactylosporangium siamense TaxID=685454 RepID=A0A919UJB3_9ACTN|nr:membrane dipeptidase [Dactylosporangium siamense]GIG52513.1 membrane dipeptidase [Dactylosporangium siamense]